MFFCNECGAEVAKWSGKCPVCGAWNSLRETSRIIGKKKKRNLQDVLNLEGFEESKPEPLKDVEVGIKVRLTSQISEFDGVLGGGLVPGMVVLIGGEPGIGKSTLMLQVSNQIAKNGKRVLYVSGEESKSQIKLRSDRLKCDADNLFLFCTTSFDEIEKAISDSEPEVLIIDTIQSVYVNSVESSPGSVSQLRECTSLFIRIAKQKSIPIFLIGHVTKDGIVAGPKIIEHMVDTVLYFEGESQNQFKILRATKNRFGSTNEIGIFEMQLTGLQEVKNPSKLFLSREENNTGSAVGCVLEGSRAFLVEVQALVSPASYGTSQRVALGFDHRKLAVLLAVIEKNLSLNLRNNDVFINLAGGMKVLEPALDLAIIAAIISSFKERALPANTLLLGEVGLNGEIRPVSQVEKRLKEAKKLGYENIIISARTKNISKKIFVSKIKHIRQLFPILFSK
ncbi:MAG: DNA repair protein RadA [Candidatus Cloacimonetes bacterium]|nr:DNA repair protein RadA [Candidatus Cloacimonadota bacterium]